MNSFKKFFAAVGAFVLSTVAIQAQKYIYLYKDGSVVAKHEVASVDSVSIVEVKNDLFDSNGHEYVDMGLPSGTLWATYNVGATSPDEYGDYYAWGETETKENYTYKNSVWYNVDSQTLQSEGVIDEAGNLTSNNDVATVLWGGSWRMPTKDEFDELRTTCKSEWTMFDLNYGRMFTGTNGNKLFFPAAGQYKKTNILEDNGKSGWYFSATSYGEAFAYSLSFTSNSNGVSVSPYNRSRCYGYTVRPVLSQIPSTQFLYIYENETLLAKYNVDAIDSLSFEPKISISETELLLDKADDVVSLGFACYPEGDLSASDILWSSSNNRVAIVKDGVVTPINVGKCVIKGTYGSQNVVCNVIVMSNSTDFEYVDLGLPSGTLWATFNVGATKPYEYGDHFAWGETETKSSYTSDNSKWYKVSCDELKAQGVIENGVLTPKYDAVTVNWGEEWRTPTESEINELLELPYEEVEVSGVKCIMFIGTNGNSIFIPFIDISVNKKGMYWSSTPNCTANDWYSEGMHLIGGKVNRYDYERYSGNLVRPVRMKGREEILADTFVCDDRCVDLGLESGTLWASFNIGATKPEELGGYFAWGETEEKYEYTDENSKWDGVDYTELQAQGVIDENGNITAKYDVATAYWGRDWRMPTDEEIEELLTLKSEKVTVNGVQGVKFIGKNGNSVFFPFAGFRRNARVYDGVRDRVGGTYWGAGAYSIYSAASAINLFYDGDVGRYGEDLSDGFSVRAVRRK